ncbi:MAG: ImmA/IrrE family metallo-endopeptidase [Paracoccaceae bacterium]
MAKAYINHEILSWAAKRSGHTSSSLAEKLSTANERVDAWLEGAELPTFKQAQRLASALQIPFGFLYLPEPPSEQIPTVEFRRLPGVSNRLSRDVFDLLSDIEFKRDWYRDYRSDEGFEPLEFVGRFQVDDSASHVANDIRRELSRSSNSLFSSRKTYERFLDEFMKAAEKIGVWVMRSGVVGNNTHRTIPVEYLRGFAIADPIVPLVFLNGRDSKSAQIFTFAHELAHLWIGKSSIEFGDLSETIPEGDPQVEKKCNAIAAEVLVPSNEFAQMWSSEETLFAQVDGIAEAFSVSRVVIARRALEQGYVAEDEYREFFASEAKRWAELTTPSAGGGSYYSNIPARNGRTFTKAVAREAAVGRLMFRDAGQLLGVQPSKVREIYERSRD